MANNKTSSHRAAFIHATTYSLPFLILSPSPLAFAVILITHFFIDRYRLARFVVYGKEWLLSPTASRAPAVPLDQQANPSPFPRPDLPVTAWENCSKTGYPVTKPDWLAVWLLIAADNALHLLINHVALTYL